MSLTGHLSDLSLSELIEFFCNQRKTGRLTVLYPQGPGYFYLQTGSVVDARIGVLRGIDAVYYALTLPNAKFEFSGAHEAVDRSINQPWTQVVLEGLRRLDEGIEPLEAFTEGYEDEPSLKNEDGDDLHAHQSSMAPAFFSFLQNESVARRKPFVIAGVAVAVIASVAIAGVPAGWYSRAKAVVTSGQTANTTVNQAETNAANETTAEAQPVVTEEQQADPAALAAKRQREREKAARAREEKENQPQSVVKPAPAVAENSEPAKSGPKKVTVTVTYDESGRVVQASGADPTAIRIARQKRFPAGKAGSATVTIPIN